MPGRGHYVNRIIIGVRNTVGVRDGGFRVVDSGMADLRTVDSGMKVWFRRP